MAISVSRQYKKLMLGAVGTVFALAVAFLFAYVHIAAVSTPFKDEFVFHQLFTSGINKQLDLQEILRPHNGHPYWTWKLIALSLMAGNVPWKAHGFLTVSFLAVACLPLLLTLAEGVTLRRVALCIGVIACALSVRQWENLLWAMQVSVAIWLACVTWSLFLVQRYLDGWRFAYGLGAVCLAGIASVSLGAGVVLVLVIAFLLLLNERDVMRRYLWFAVSVGLLVLFLYHQTLATETGTRPALGSVVALGATAFATHVLVFLSNGVWTFGAERSTMASAVGALLACLAVSCFVLYMWGRHRRRQHAAVGLILVGLGTAVLVAVARLGTGVIQPDAPRYTTMAAPLLLGLLLFSAFQGDPATKALRVVGSLGILLSGLVVFAAASAARNEWGTGPYRYRAVSAHHDALCTGKTERIAFDYDRSALRLDVARLAFCDYTAARLSTDAGMALLREVVWFSGLGLKEGRLQAEADVVVIVPVARIGSFVLEGSVLPQDGANVSLLVEETVVAATRVDSDGKFRIAYSIDRARSAGFLRLQIRVRGARGELVAWSPVRLQ